jgi:hypothetical protein
MNADNAKDMTQKIAIFRHLRFGFTSVFALQEGHDENWTLDEYVRISEWQAIDFKALPPNSLAEAQMRSLKNQRAMIVTEFKRKLEVVDSNIANLRALTGPVTP